MSMKQFRLAFKVIRNSLAIHNGKPNLPLFATQAPYYRYTNQTKCNGGTEVTCVAGPHLIRTYTRIAMFFSNRPADHYSYFLR